MADPQDQTPKALLAHARHELRTPVNAIIGYSEMLLEDAEELEQADFCARLKEVHTLGKQVHTAINGLLDGAKIEQTQAMDFAVLGAEVRRQLRPPCQQVLACCERLLRQAEEPTLQTFRSDLQRIVTAVSRLLTMLDNPLGAAPAVSEAPRTEQPQQPAQHVTADAASEFDADLMEDQPASGRGHILVVDDNQFNRDMLARGLHRQHHSFALAGNGREALEILASGAFDLVLLDIMMPEMDGFQVLERIKASPELRHVPVIMISALDEIASVVRCIEMGAEDYLPKPFDPVLLRARVGACLEKKRLRDQELDYLRNVAAVTTAAAAVESGQFDPDILQPVAERTDQLGQLARVFQSMAREVRAREQRLQQQVQQLRVEVDEHRKANQVAEITDSNYFQQLQQRARALRNRKPGGQE